MVRLVLGVVLAMVSSLILGVASDSSVGGPETALVLAETAVVAATAVVTLHLLAVAASVISEVAAAAEAAVLALGLAVTWW